jgi:predicted esterase
MTKKILLIHFHALTETADDVNKYIHDFIKEANVGNNVEIDTFIPDAETYGHSKGVWFPIDPSNFTKMFNMNLESIIPNKSADPKQAVYQLLAAIAKVPLFYVIGSMPFFEACIKPVVQKLNSVIDAELEKRGLTDENLILSGFSMGGIMSASIALSRKSSCLGLLSCNSFYFPTVTQLIVPKYIKIVANNKDNVIPIELHKFSYSLLKTYTTFDHVINDLDDGHGLGEQGRKEIIGFLSKCLTYDKPNDEQLELDLEFDTEILPD